MESAPNPLLWKINCAPSQRFLMARTVHREQPDLLLFGKMGGARKRGRRGKEAVVSACK